MDLSATLKICAADDDGQNNHWLQKNIDHSTQIWINVLIDTAVWYIVWKAAQKVETDSIKKIPWPTGDYWYNIKLNGAKDNLEFSGYFTPYR